MDTLPCSDGDVYQGFFRYLPVARVSFDEAGDDDKQEHEHVDRSEDFIDPGRLLHAERQESLRWAKRAAELRRYCSVGLEYLRFIFNLLMSSRYAVGHQHYSLLFIQYHQVVGELLQIVVIIQAYLQEDFGRDCFSLVSRFVFQSGGWRFNPRPSQCVLEQNG